MGTVPLEHRAGSGQQGMGKRVMLRTVKDIIYVCAKSQSMVGV